MSEESWPFKTQEDLQGIQSSYNSFQSTDPFPSQSTADKSYIFEPQGDPTGSPVMSSTPSNYLVPHVGRLKVFVGGLPQTATAEELRSHFCQFGESIMEVEIKMDKITGRSRGFGFVTICNCDSTRLFNSLHRISGKIVDVAEVTETKLFVGGLRPSTVREHLAEYFSRFGTVVNSEVMYDPCKPTVSRGFGFVIFETIEGASNALMEQVHWLDERKVEVRKAEPKRKPLSYYQPSNQSSHVSTPTGHSVMFGQMHMSLNHFRHDDAMSSTSSYGQSMSTYPMSAQMIYGSPVSTSVPFSNQITPSGSNVTTPSHQQNQSNVDTSMAGGSEEYEHQPLDAITSQTDGVDQQQQRQKLDQQYQSSLNFNIQQSTDISTHSHNHDMSQNHNHAYQHHQTNNMNNSHHHHNHHHNQNSQHVFAHNHYGVFGGYGEYEAGPPPPPPRLTYGALGVPSTYGFPAPVPGYDLIPGVGTSNRFHPLF